MQTTDLVSSNVMIAGVKAFRRDAHILKNAALEDRSLTDTEALKARQMRDFLSALVHECTIKELGEIGCLLADWRIKSIYREIRKAE